MDATTPGGFPAFREAIESISADLGGSKGGRVAVFRVWLDKLQPADA